MSKEITTKEELLNSLSWATEVKGVKAQHICSEYARAERNHITNVREAYGRCSNEKKYTFDAIQTRAFSDGAEAVYISGHNTSTYSTIYKICLYDCIAYIKDTRDNTYIAFVSRLN